MLADPPEWHQPHQAHRLRFVRGSKGKPKMLLNGYAYFRNNAYDDKTYWLCSRNRSLKCKARLITLHSKRELIVKNQRHNHSREPDEMVVAAGQSDGCVEVVYMSTGGGCMDMDEC